MLFSNSLSGLKYRAAHGVLCMCASLSPDCSVSWTVIPFRQTCIRCCQEQRSDSTNKQHLAPQAPVSTSCVALPEALLLMSAGGVVQSVQKVPGYLHEVSRRRGGAGPYAGHKASEEPVHRSKWKSGNFCLNKQFLPSCLSFFGYFYLPPH